MIGWFNPFQLAGTGVTVQSSLVVSVIALLILLTTAELSALSTNRVFFQASHS
jgi:hypothetical protein